MYVDGRARTAKRFREMAHALSRALDSSAILPLLVKNEYATRIIDMRVIFKVIGVYEQYLKGLT